MRKLLNFNVKEIGAIDVAPILSAFEKINLEALPFRPEPTLGQGKMIRYSKGWIDSKREIEYSKEELDLIEATIPIEREIFQTFFTPRDEWLLFKGEFSILPPKSFFPPHVDPLWYTNATTRIIVPIASNYKCYASFDDGHYCLEAGKIYEFNNGVVHSVHNNSDEPRLNLLLSYLRKDVLREYSAGKSNPAEAYFAYTIDQKLAENHSFKYKEPAR